MSWRNPKGQWTLLRSTFNWETFRNRSEVNYSSSICKIRAWLQKYWCKKTKVKQTNWCTGDVKKAVHLWNFLVLEFSGLKFSCALNNKRFRLTFSTVLHCVRQCPYTLFPDFKSGMSPITTISLEKKKNKFGNSCLAEFESQQNILLGFFPLDICNFLTVLHNINLKSSYASLQNK